MKYIQKILQPGEKVIFSSTLSWAIYLPSIILWLVALTLLVTGIALE
jgi:hypothetical protein